MKTIVVVLCVMLAAMTVACDRDGGSAPAAPAAAPAAAEGGDGGKGAPVATASSADALAHASPAPPASRLARVVFLGDSLTAGYGLEADQAFPALVGRMLQDEGLQAEIVNAGVSGDTTAGGLRRLDWQLRQKPDVVVVGLGGNDGLRGLELRASEENLRAIIRKSRDAGAAVVLLGMLIPPNYGPDYAGQFRELYPRLARELDVPLVPFLLEGVGGDPRLNLPDGIHPTADGHRIVARNVLPQLRDALRQGRAAPATTRATR
ncbi:MAG TPA: arylesterase [Tepidisphaeraceae bacterium]|nr:arylesterase [Tepidisphaeraceae bacterium]